MCNTGEMEINFCIKSSNRTTAALKSKDDYVGVTVCNTGEDRKKFLVFEICYWKDLFGKYFIQESGIRFSYY